MDVGVFLDELFAKNGIEFIPKTSVFTEVLFCLDKKYCLY